MNVHDIMIDYLRREVCEKSGRPVPTLNEPLLDSQGGVIDSVNLWPLIGFVESRFDITIEDTDLMEENFQTLEAWINFIESKHPKLQP